MCCFANTGEQKDTIFISDLFNKHKSIRRYEEDENKDDWDKDNDWIEEYDETEDENNDEDASENETEYEEDDSSESENETEYEEDDSSESENEENVDFDLPDYILKYKSAKYDIDTRLALKIPPEKIIFDEDIYDMFEMVFGSRIDHWSEFKAGETTTLGYIVGDCKSTGPNTYTEYGLHFYDIGDGVKVQIGLKKSLRPPGSTSYADHIITNVYAHSYYVQTGEPCDSDTDSD